MVVALADTVLVLVVFGTFAVAVVWVVLVLVLVPLILEWWSCHWCGVGVVGHGAGRPPAAHAPASPA